jgi:hypothetical protein
VIKNSGQLTPEEFAQWEQEQQSAGGSKWEEYPEDADEDFDKEGGVEKALDAAKEIRESGNGLFRAGKYAKAAREYESTCLFLLILLHCLISEQKRCGISTSTLSSLMMCQPRHKTNIAFSLSLHY